jgi:hypothetical protein
MGARYGFKQCAMKIREIESTNKYSRIAIYIITGDAETVQQYKTSNVVDGVISKPIVKKELVAIVQAYFKI